ncbi:hypothetical protein Tco_0498772 [Tanacetum coccineum]
MAISIISISSDLSEESVGTSTARVILFGMIPTTITSTAPTTNSPVIHNDTLLIPTDTPTISPTIPSIAPTIQQPLQDPYEVTAARWRSRVAACSSPPSSPTHDSPPTLHQILPALPELPHRPAVLVLLGHPIPVGRPYRHSISDSHCDSPTTISVGPSYKRCRSPTTSVPMDLPIPKALSLVRADLLSPRKRVKDSDSMTNIKVSLEEGYVLHVPREIGLRVYVEDSYEPYTEPDIDLDVQADIDACIAFTNDIAARGTNARVKVGTMAEEEVESSVRVTIEIGVDRVTHPVVSDDITEPVREDFPELISVDGSLERDLRQIRRFQFYDHVRTMSTATHSGMTKNAIDELIAKRVAKALEAYDTARNSRTKTEMEDDHQDDNVEANGNNGNGNGNGNGNPNVNNGGVVPVTRECTYQDFVKCQPLNLKGTEGVIGLTRWFEKMETVFHITNFPPKYQVKYASCTLLSDGPGRGGLVRIANNLIDQKLKGCAVKNAKNKRRFDNNPRDNHGQQQQPPKRQNVNGQNVARAYMVGKNVERKAYAGNLPYCNKDCKAAVAATAQRAPIGNHTGNNTGNNEAKARSYAIGGGGASPDSIIVTGTFLLNNRYASMLFDLGADRIFVSTTFSALLDVIPSTLDVSDVL